MAVRVGINGFGRIGRQILRIAYDMYPGEIEFVAFNDIGELPQMAHLLKYDSNYGQFGGNVEVRDGNLYVNGNCIRAFTEKEPSKIPWGDVGADIVIESTGKFVSREQCQPHLDAGAKKVIISAPAKGEIDLTVVLGVNQDMYDPARHHVVSNASCTTNCLAPAAKVVHDKFTIKRGFMTTVHSYTNDQKVLDMPHSDLRRARASGLNIIPTTTGAAKAVALVIPELKGKFDGYSLRVPTPTVSVVDFTAELEKETTTEELRQAFRDAAKQPRFKGILEAVDEPLVSMDFKGSSYSSSVDLPFTSVLGKEKSNFVKVVTWYDNEWGYSCRTADLAALMAKSL
jgi:glyceraldehyde 3-phosphate dehydrogenase